MGTEIVVTRYRADINPNPSLISKSWALYAGKEIMASNATMDVLINEVVGQGRPVQGANPFNCYSPAETTKPHGTELKSRNFC